MVHYLLAASSPRGHSSRQGCSGNHCNLDPKNVTTVTSALVRENRGRTLSTSTRSGKPARMICAEEWASPPTCFHANHEHAATLCSDRTPIEKGRHSPHRILRLKTGYYPYFCRCFGEFHNSSLFRIAPLFLGFSILFRPIRPLVNLYRRNG